MSYKFWVLSLLIFSVNSTVWSSGHSGPTSKKRPIETENTSNKVPKLNEQASSNIEWSEAPIPYIEPEKKPTRSEIIQVFSKFYIKNRRKIEVQKNTTVVSCYSRAEKITRNLREKGFQPLKIWKFWADKWRDPVYDLEWRYHVSIGLEDKTGQKWAFDPWWYEGGPIKIEEWVLRENED